MAKRILFLSNGHGEDLNGSLVVQALQQLDPTVEISALPLVGAGHAYKKLNVPIIGPTQSLPSGGFIYMGLGQAIRDLFAGLPKLTLAQLKAVRRHCKDFDLVFAVGDIVPIAFARWSGRPYSVFLVSNSSYYTGRMRLPLWVKCWLRSQRCRSIFTRDKYSSEELSQRGYAAQFAGYPIMDTLQPQGIDLALLPDQPLIALLPGSRPPEALHNLERQLQLCQVLSQQAPERPLQFRAALVPSITEADLSAIADRLNWQYQPPHTLIGPHCTVRCPSNAFADMLHRCDLVIGMAGTAVEQAVGLGKPVIQIIGDGPQFTYRFAEGQMRLLGPSVETIGKTPATPAHLEQAAQRILAILQDPDHQERCRQNGLSRVGPVGGSARMAHHLLNSQ
jgi:uncharacterized protein (TIGR03492 family)